MEKFSIDSKGFITSFILDKNEGYFILIDEAHYCKDIGQKLKFLYDSSRNVKFIIAGSSSMKITPETARS